MKKNLLALVSGVLLVGNLLAQDLPPQRQINIISALHSYDLNPMSASYTSEAQLFTGIYEGLFSYDPMNLNPLPAICVSYKTSRDKKRWTFTLRENAKFSDGSKITAQTVKDSWMKLLATPNAPFASLIDSISGAQEFRTGKGPADKVRIDVRDEKTVVVHLREPAGHLPKILCHHAFSIVSPKKGVYSGAFVLDSIKDNIVLLKKNENYWDAENVKIPGIKIELTNDYPENSFKYNVGEADWVMGNAEASKIINKDSIVISPQFATMYLFFKTKNSPWDKAEFRTALLEAIPYDKLRGGYTVQAQTLVYPLTGYPSVKGISDYDGQDALDMMNAAREKYNIPLDEKIPLVFAISSEDTIKNWGKILKECWEPLGVDLILQTTLTERYNSSIEQWNADLFYYSWIGDFADPLAFLELFRSNSTLNVAGYKNEEFDNLLLEASRLDSIQEQYKLMSRAEQILLDDSEIIPISHPISANLINTEEIGGWQKNALDLHPLKYLYIKSLPKLNIPNLAKLENIR